MAELDLVPVAPGSILVVEDDADVGGTLVQILRHDGHAVRLAHDVAQASQLISAETPEVVVSDIYMPGLTGLDLLAAIGKNGGGIEVILLSGEPSLDTAREAVRRGAFEYLVKPVSARALRRAVADALEKRRAQDRSGREREAERERLRALEGTVEERTRELSESRERYRQLVEGLPLVVFELDAATERFTYQGGGLLEQLGSDFGSLPEWVSRIRDEDRAAVRTGFTRIVSAETALETVEFRLRLPNGAVRWLRSVSSVTGSAPRRIAGFIADVTEQHLAEQEKKRLEQELERARAALDQSLLHQLDLGSAGPAVRIEDGGLPVGEAESEFGTSVAMRQVLASARLATEHDEPVLVTGETGTGKGMLTEWIHAHGERHAAPFVALNCSSLRGELLESELFGHTRGAFTSAVRDRKGLVEEASSGTLFLDEIGEMSLETQARLLKVLEDKTFRRLGESSSRKSDFRLLCATNRSLAEEVARGRFRQDLYFRINVFTIELPPLRERPGDIALLARRLLSELDAGSAPIAPAAMRLLEAHSWPGNVRELKNALIRATLLARGGPLLPRHFPELARADATAGVPEAPEQEVDGEEPSEEAGRIRDLVRAFDGNLAKVARTLRISRTTLYRKLSRYGIEPPR